MLQQTCLHRTTVEYLIDTTAATFNPSSTSRMQHVTPGNDNMSSDEDRILDDKGYNPLDTYGDIDKDTERKLLDCDNDDLDLVGNPNAKPNNRKWKTSQPDDVVRLKSKLFKKTLGLARKENRWSFKFWKKIKITEVQEFSEICFDEGGTSRSYILFIFKV